MEKNTNMATSCNNTPTKLTKMEFDMFSHEDGTFRQNLAAMRETGTFCDATISIPDEEKKFPVHRAIMASCSDFFRSLFTNGFRETLQNEVTIHDVSVKTMECIIEYAYTKQANMTQDNVEDILTAADRFGIMNLLEECIDFLSNQLSPENCISILRFSKFYNCTTLHERCWVFLMKHIVEVMKRNQEFVQLQIEELLEIVRDDSLNVSKEDDVFDAVMKWVDFFPRERKQHIKTLLESVRLPLISEDGFNHKIFPRRDLKRTSCMDRINMSFNLVKKFCPSNNPMLKPRKKDLAKWIKPRIPNSLMFVIGGWAKDGVTESVESYDRNTDQWFEVRECELPTPRAYHATVTIQDKVYVLGGFNGSHYLNSFTCFDVSLKKWEERAPMYMSRCYVCAAEVNGTVYACGGFDGRQRHNSVERYDSTKNQWTLVKPMFHQRSDAGAAHFKGKLYVSGGFDGHSCLFSTEVYDPDTNQWSVLAPMATRRSGVSLIVCDDKLYAIGGYDGMRRLESVEYMEPNKRHWYAGPGMVLGRSNFSCVVMEDVIYVMGGYDGDKTAPQVEYFSPEKKVWCVLNDLNIGRSAVSACAVCDIHNARDFTFHGNAHMSKDTEIALRGPTSDEKNKEYAKWLALWRKTVQKTEEPCTE